MAELLKGAPVAAAIRERVAGICERTRARGAQPKLAVVRVGERPDDLAYERGALKSCERAGVAAEVFALPAGISDAAFQDAFAAVCADTGNHGVLLFRPLPKGLDEAAARAAIPPEKDVDCMSPANFAKLFQGDPSGFAPCTPRAVMETLRHYGVSVQGKRVTLVGRSLVVGKPLAMLLLAESATLTVCHTKTQDLAAECRRAEILVAAAGSARMITAGYVSPGAVVVDVGMNVDETGALCGDVDFEAVSAVASRITPVPGGVGSVTSSVLALHTALACAASLGLPN